VYSSVNVHFQLTAIHYHMNKTSTLCTVQPNPLKSKRERVTNLSKRVKAKRNCGGEVRDTLFGGRGRCERASFFFEGSQAIPACPDMERIQKSARLNNI
jgi:hypothetical protein